MKSDVRENNCRKLNLYRPVLYIYTYLFPKIVVLGKASLCIPAGVEDDYCRTARATLLFFIRGTVC